MEKILILYFSKFRAFRTLHPPKQNVILEVLIETGLSADLENFEKLTFRALKFVVLSSIPWKPMQWPWKFMLSVFDLLSERKRAQITLSKRMYFFCSNLSIIHILGVILTFLQLSLFTLNNFIALRVTVFLCFYKAVSTL